MLIERVPNILKQIYGDYKEQQNKRRKSENHFFLFPHFMNKNFFYRKRYYAEADHYYCIWFIYGQQVLCKQHNILLTR